MVDSTATIASSIILTYHGASERHTLNLPFGIRHPPPNAECDTRHLGLPPGRGATRAIGVAGSGREMLDCGREGYVLACGERRVGDGTYSER
jgi:hypothetical protein